MQHMLNMKYMLYMKCMQCYWLAVNCEETGNEDNGDRYLQTFIKYKQMALGNA